MFSLLVASEWLKPDPFALVDGWRPSDLLSGTFIAFEVDMVASIWSKFKSRYDTFPVRLGKGEAKKLTVYRPQVPLVKG
jgi:hypothetical protein